MRLLLGAAQRAQLVALRARLHTALPAAHALLASLFYTILSLQTSLQATMLTAKFRCVASNEDEIIAKFALLAAL